jgi:hypothetical protein
VTAPVTPERTYLGTRGDSGWTRCSRSDCQREHAEHHAGELAMLCPAVVSTVPAVMSTVYTETTLVLFDFSSDDETFRSRLFAAIYADLCPDFTRSLGGSDRNYAALWRPEHADAVRAWARSVGAELVNASGRGGRW